MTKSRWLPVLLGVVLVTPVGAVQLGPQVFPSVGGSVAASAVILSFSAALPIAGTVSSGGFRETCGYWFPRSAPVGAVLPLDSPSTGVTMIRPCFPNPSTAPRFAFEIAGRKRVPARLEVFTVSGRSVSVPVASSLAPGSYEVSWDGKDLAGRTLPAGIYLARFTTPDLLRTFRVVLVR
jgi:hypothetical protein